MPMSIPAEDPTVSRRGSAPRRWSPSRAGVGASRCGSHEVRVERAENSESWDRRCLDAVGLHDRDSPSRGIGVDAVVRGNVRAEDHVLSMCRPGCPAPGAGIVFLVPRKSAGRRWRARPRIRSSSNRGPGYTVLSPFRSVSRFRSVVLVAAQRNVEDPVRDLCGAKGGGRCGPGRRDRACRAEKSLAPRSSWWGSPPSLRRSPRSLILNGRGEQLPDPCCARSHPREERVDVVEVEEPWVWPNSCPSSVQCAQVDRPDSPFGHDHPAKMATAPAVHDYESRRDASPRLIWNVGKSRGCRAQVV